MRSRASRAAILFRNVSLAQMRSNTRTKKTPDLSPGVGCPEVALGAADNKGGGEAASVSLMKSLGSFQFACCLRHGRGGGSNIGFGHVGRLFHDFGEVVVGGVAGGDGGLERCNTEV
jgi:hypothetical protein